ncbi:heavy-metal-associated domain-containing protein [Sphingomonas sp. ID1715]|uniref:heavy-metal-associated domain-containing protein n=1 Tax=Sphingomonas sp. ID1715 TaxID=1656898 RepID=UPI0014885ED1|nr:heavy-metal-associated domain-containing protein [Sphingomonas sp. ID1715]NNM77778.1 heavy-metal-associated domain-containing protein [Sphingomonas sp. ID1715]
MVEFSVQGMSCGHCVRTIAEAVRRVDPGAETRVDLSAGAVSIDSGVDASQLRQAIEGAGYSVTAKIA